MKDKLNIIKKIDIFFLYTIYFTILIHKKTNVIQFYHLFTIKEIGNGFSTYLKYFYYT